MYTVRVITFWQTCRDTTNVFGNHWRVNLALPRVCSNDRYLCVRPTLAAGPVSAQEEDEAAPLWVDQMTSARVSMALYFEPPLAESCLDGRAEYDQETAFLENPESARGRHCPAFEFCGLQKAGSL